MLRSLSTIAFGILLAALGMLAGWQVGSHGPDDHDHEHEHEHEHDEAHDEDHDHEEEDHDHDEDHPELSEQTLKTLGVEVQALKLRDFVQTVDVRAVLVDRPENHRTVVTPVGGIVGAVHVESGAVVEAGAPILGFTRDPIPLRNQETVVGIVLPVREVVHGASSTLRTARTELKIADSELQRIRGLQSGDNGKLPDLFASRLVELSYDRERAARKVSNAEAELRHHGLEGDEIARIADGEHPPSMLDLWRRILRKHEIWGDLEERILARLPASERGKPWPIALIAELSMQGMIAPALLTFLEAHPRAATRFREISALLLDGQPLESVELIAEMGALEPHVVLRTPESGAAHWDVERLLAKVGQRLATGESVAELYDPRRLWLRLEPVGSEIAHVRRAVQDHLPCRAAPVLPGAAPDLPTVHLRRLAGHGDQGTVAFAEVQNDVLHQEEERRSWSLHAGTEYVVQVPLETLPGRFVLPVEAVIRHGPDRVVYVLEEHDEHEDHEDHEDHEHEDHEHEEDPGHPHEDHGEDEDHDDEHHHIHFHPVPVHVELEAGSYVIIAADAALEEGQEVVVRGAFALHLALQRRGGESEAGHGHSHH